MESAQPWRVSAGEGEGSRGRGGTRHERARAREGTHERPSTRGGRRREGKGCEEWGEGRKRWRESGGGHAREEAREPRAPDTQGRRSEGSHGVPWGVRGPTAHMAALTVSSRRRDVVRVTANDDHEVVDHPSGEGSARTSARTPAPTSPHSDHREGSSPRRFSLARRSVDGHDRPAGLA